MDADSILLLFVCPSVIRGDVGGDVIVGPESAGSVDEESGGIWSWPMDGGVRQVEPGNESHARGVVRVTSNAE